MNLHQNNEQNIPRNTSDDELQRHIYPVHTDEYWHSFEEGVMARIEQMQTPLAQQSRASKLRILFALPALRAAAILVLGIGIGFAAARFAEPSTLLTTSRETARETSEASVFTAALDYLEASNLLFLGMASLSGECGVRTSRTVQTLVSQRECSRTLLLKTTAIKQELAALPQSEQREHLRSLIAQVEFALSAIAAMEPTTLDAARIEQIQSCSDNALCELNARRRSLVARAVTQ
jgi:hypothetical protein